VERDRPHRDHQRSPIGRAARTTAPAEHPTRGSRSRGWSGIITYLSAQAVGEKFGRRFQRGGDLPLYDIAEPDFEVESYLRYQAEAFAARFDANAYLYISRALTYFDLARTYGHGSL